MLSTPAVEDLLYNHVFGSGSPLQTLLDSGTLSEAWVDSYVTLVEEAHEQWSAQPLWPRQLVAAVHSASWYLELRYQCWSTNAHQMNSDTEMRLNRVRRVSEAFLLSPSFLQSNDT